MPSLQDGDCAGTVRTWKTGSTHVDLSIPFVGKHELKANIREEIANIPADTLVRVMANIRNRFIQSMDKGERHLPDVIFKTVKNETLNMYYHNETKIKLLWIIKLVLLPFGKNKLCCHSRTTKIVRHNVLKRGSEPNKHHSHRAPRAVAARQGRAPSGMPRGVSGSAGWWRPQTA